MTRFMYFKTLLVCILWTSIINQCDSKLDQNFTSLKFTNSLSFPSPYSITKSEKSRTPQRCNATDDFSNLVHKSLRRQDNFNLSCLQELMVRGYQILCLWTQHVKEKFKIQSQLKYNNQPLSLLEDIPFSTKDGQFYLHNITFRNFPSQHEKIIANPLNGQCTMFKTTYQAKSNETTIQGDISANGFRSHFILVYQNVSILLSDIKTRTNTKTADILSTPVRTEYNFDNFIAYTNTSQNINFFLDSMTPSLLQEIIFKDPSHRLAYAKATQDVKIADFNKQDVLRLMSSVVVHYLRTRYKKPFRLPIDHTRRLGDSIEYVQIDGLNRCKVCGSNMQLVQRGDNLSMRLIFSISFSEDDKNHTTLTIRENGSVSQNRTIVVKKLSVRLDFSSLLKLETSEKLHFHLTDVKAEVVEKFPVSWYEPFKPNLNALLSEILAEIVLSWILYETN